MGNGRIGCWREMDRTQAKKGKAKKKGGEWNGQLLAQRESDRSSNVALEAVLQPFRFNIHNFDAIHLSKQAIPAEEEGVFKVPDHINIQAEALDPARNMDGGHGILPFA